MKPIPLLLPLLLPLLSFSADAHAVFPSSVPAPVGPYSPGVVVGEYLYVSGQGAHRPDGSMPDTFAEQVRQTLENVKAVLEAGGLTMDAIECIVRGYLSGSGWKKYKKSQTVCGIKLPAGLTESAELPEPIFTPSTKAEAGHDENISFEEACKITGTELATQARDLSLKIYRAGRDYAKQRGIIIADTKFEFGLFAGKLILIDEVLTPDSSRFWPADQYAPGRGQPSFDKQFVRDYLETLDWNKTPPGPKLPDQVVAKTSAKYLEAYEKLTGKKL